MREIRIAIVGVGNCASSLVQGLYFYRKASAEPVIGLMHQNLGGYEVKDIKVVAAWDIDARKVGKDLSQAIFAPPNCTKVFEPEVPQLGITVRMGRIMDGISEHMQDYPPHLTFMPASEREPTLEEVVDGLRESRAEILINYLPVGSEEATRFYAQCALEAGVGFINCMPVFIASDPTWGEAFEKRGIPVIGDDIKSQIGATIVNRVLAELFSRRGVKVDHIYQLNVGGNTDFLNMLNRSRLLSKKISKTEAVQSAMEVRMEDGSIHIGPSDYVPWLRDNKVCFLRLEGRIFGNVPINLELRLSVEDSPNSAGVAIDAIRCCKLALDRGIGGPLVVPSAYFMKHPPRQIPDMEAFRLLEEFITQNGSPSS